MYKRSEINKKKYTSGEIAKLLDYDIKWVQQLDRKGRLPFKRTPSNKRVMFQDDLIAYLNESKLLIDNVKSDKRDVIYARVSSHEQKTKGDLDRQVVFILEYASDLEIQKPLIFKEVGSGLNDNRKQIQKLIKMVVTGEANRVFINYKDRLTRFGFHYLETVFLAHEVEIIVVNDECSDKSIQDERVEDMMSLIACFSGKLYGMRGKAKKKSIETIKSIPNIEC